MGYIINRKARGIYYVDVNGWSPFGKANSNLVPEQFDCAKSKC